MRLRDLARGFMGVFVDNMEEKNPEIFFADIKNKIEKNRKEAEQQIIDIRMNAEMIKIEMKKAEGNLNQIRARIDMIRDKGDKEALITLLIREEECSEIYQNHLDAYNNAEKEAEKIWQDYKIFERDLNSKLNEIKTLKSRIKTVSIRESINSINNSYNHTGSKIGKINESLDRAREMVDKRVARSNALNSMHDIDTELSIKKIDINSARERARIKAEKMLEGEKTI